MKEILDDLKVHGTEASFCFGGAPNNPIIGKVVVSTDDKTVIQTFVNGTDYRYITHPSNIVIVERH
jgi:hypothetical protein